MVAGMNQLKPSLDAADVALVAVGMGTAAQAEAFLKHTKFDGELWVDPNPKGTASCSCVLVRARACSCVLVRACA